MNIKVSVVLLHFLTITVPISQYAAKSFSVLASDIEVNETQSKIRKISTIMTTATIVSETNVCNDRFCYSPTNETTATTATTTNKSKEFAPSYKEYDRLKSTSILYGVVKTAAQRSQANDICYRELNQIYDGIHRKEIWAIKALDSSAMPLPGFVLGNNFWMGSVQGCGAVQKPPPLTLSNRFERFMHTDLWSATAPFDIGYRMVYAEHRSPWQMQVEFTLEKNKVLHVGLCLPQSCSNDQIANLTQEFFDSSTLDAQIMHDYQPNVLEVTDLKAKTNLMDRWSFRIVVCCVIFTLLMMVIAYIRDGSENDEVVKIEHPIATRTEINGIVSSPPDVVMHCPKTSVPKKMFLDEIVECFSLRKNMQILTSVDKPANAVPIVDGLKSIGCFLILMFHVYWFNHFTVHNVTMTFSYGEQTLWQWVSATPIIVDVFFTISGLLLTYNFLRNQSKQDEIRNNSLMQNVKLFGKQLLNRYIRLTPMYLVVVGCMEFMTSRMVETSPFWIHERNDMMCSKYWWRNVLYIQNLFSQDELCVNWSWSLACEMQFFILSTVLLFIYAKYPNAAKAIFCSLFGIFFGLIFSIAIFTKFTPAYDVMHSLGTDMYIAPWTRVLPYLIGVAAGYVMYTLKGEMPLGEKTIKMVWTVTITIAILAHVSTLNRNVSYVTAALLITFIRVLYPVSVSWMILASHTGYGGLFAKILNFPVFVHINKLSYGIYLLNPAVISVLYGWQDHSTHVDPVSMTVMTTGIKVIVYLSAIVFSLMFEIPFTNLSAKILRQTSAKQKMLTSSPKTTELTIEAKKML
ncbi:O-acyltransferase like protein-like [Sitodiplosis mosellana]|uniref:O-acyltransferase like protein-like n=1 Tax=Sitodiplosis mosellana TaxID=263140 RepID=UPI002444ADD2|nr:O-acyltransferase like protein-like [Sitodiplosis mosellana]